MGVNGLPHTFAEFQKMRNEHLDQNMQHSHYTGDLFKQYRKHLGDIRFGILVEAQTLVVPQQVRELLCFRKISLLNPLLAIYKIGRAIHIDWLFKAIILPDKYKKEIVELDHSLA